MELPNFNIDRVQNPWGYDLSVVVSAMANTVKQILNERACIVIAHDWGAFISELLILGYKDQIQFDRLVLLDVADGTDDAEERKKMAYQMYLVAYFLMPTVIGTWYIRRLFAAFPFRAPLLDKEKRDNKVYLSSYQAYLYYYIISGALLFGKRYDIRNQLDKLDGLPILFIDATAGDNPMVFYSSKFRKHLEARDYCKFVEFEDCNHWIMTQNPTKLNDTVYDFIQK